MPNFATGAGQVLPLKKTQCLFIKTLFKKLLDIQYQHQREEKIQ
jgi:hypothetical protein